MNTHQIFYVTLALGCIGLFPNASSADSNAPEHASAGVQQPVAVQSSRAVQRSVLTFEDVTGTTRAQMKTTIAAKLSGRVEKILVSPGQEIKIGELLMEIEAADIKAKLEQALAVARQADLDLKRISKLLAQNSAAKQDYDLAATRNAVAQAAVAEAQTTLGYAKITAPFDGIVSNKLVDIGSLAVPGSPLLEVMTAGAMRFEAEVPASLLSRISIGQVLQVRIGSLPEKVAARVSEIIPTADPNSRTVLIKLDLPRIAGIVPGLFGRVAIPTGERSVIQIEAQSLIKRGQLEIVFVIDRNRALLRLVKTVPIEAVEPGAVPMLEVLSGVSAGEVLASSNLRELRDGIAVTHPPLVRIQPLQ